MKIRTHYRDTGDAATLCGIEAWTPKHPATEIWDEVTCTDCLASQPTDLLVELRLPEIPPNTVALLGTDRNGGPVRLLLHDVSADEVPILKTSAGDSKAFYTLGEALDYFGVLTAEKRTPRTWAPLDDAPDDLTKVQIVMGDECWSIAIHRDEDHPQWWWHGAQRKTWAELRGSKLREVL